MDNKLILVKAITLLYRESLIPENTENSSDLVRTILENIKLPELSLSLNRDRELLMALKDTCLYLCSNPVSTQYEKEELLQRLKVNCGEDEKLYEAFAQGIEKDMDEGSLKRTVLSIRKYINDAFRENEFIKLVRNASTELTFNRDKIKSIRQFAQNLSAKLEPYQIEASRKDPAIIGSVDLGDTSSLNDVFTEVKAVADHSSLMRTGWQGINRLLQGGFKRGDEIVLPALQHKYKTGFTLSLYKQLAIYNKPVMINPNKKPLLLRISFEDSLVDNVKFLYKNLIFNETGILPDIEKEDVKVMAAYVKEKMEINGFHMKMLRVNADSWTYKDLQNYVLELEANGYEIHVCIVDYLPMLPTTGCEDGPMGFALQDLYRKTRNFFSVRGTIFITPHQLSTEAKQLIRDGHQDFVKLLPGKGYYRGCKSVDQEVDCELYLHIEKFNKQFFLTVQRGKHRGVEVIPEEDLYVVLPFPPVGPIPDDIGKPEITMKKIGGKSIGTGEADEVPFWSNTDK